MLTVSLAAAMFSIAQAPAPEPKPEKAPELTKVSGWVNGKEMTIAGQKGKVVMVHFWTHGCINCVHNYPHYKSWAKTFKDQDLVMLGIHTPEFDREKKKEAIEEAVKTHALPFVVAIDNDGMNWKAWRNRYWPCVYLVDRQGIVRYHWEGELGEKGEPIMRKRITELLAESK